MIVDKNGRINLRKALRKSFKEDETLYAYFYTDSEFVICNEDRLKRIASRLIESMMEKNGDDINCRGKVKDDVRRAIYSRSDGIVLDKNGRYMLPQGVREEFAGQQIVATAVTTEDGFHLRVVTRERNEVLIKDKELLKASLKGNKNEKR